MTVAALRGDRISFRIRSHETVEPRCQNTGEAMQTSAARWPSGIASCTKLQNAPAGVGAAHEVKVQSDISQNHLPPCVDEMNSAPLTVKAHRCPSYEILDIREAQETLDLNCRP